ncbi:T9SS type A sorting domain-containing protein [Polaribacter porphyrae]|uniref:Secretion system C-terminal sorting domain-containing protein n=1 Tax=Polaribacter porphyrae TaxID=1137780 RepID=A0A2S7WNP5_9FLAO|nr:T9SS type A sorting domain-containing protein [Polaribacter porphyrae]PQJ79235.1 hypothetical protein BTO18_08645 [Polaribacter porphyrae]
MKQQYLFKILIFLLLNVSVNSFAQREITLGTNTTYNPSITQMGKTERIDDTHVITTFRDGSLATSSDIKVMIGNVSGTTITYGATVTVEADTNRYNSIEVISSTQAIISYEYDHPSGTSFDTGYSRVITFDTDTNTITNVGAAVDFSSGDVDAAFSFNPIQMVKLTDTTFAIHYADSADNGVIKIGTVSGTTITYGAAQTYTTGDVQNLYISALSSTKIVMTFEDDGDSDKGTAVIGDISGNIVTFGAEYEFNTTPISYTAVTAISETQFVVIYIIDDANDYGYAKVGTVSGNTITFSTSSYQFEGTQDARDMSIDFIGNKEFVFVYNGANGDNSKIRLGKVSGTGTLANISYNTEDIFLSNLEGDDTWVTSLTADNFVVTYVDDQETSPANDLGEYIVGTLPSITNTWSGAIDNDWNNDSNWSEIVPDKFSNPIIPSGLTNYPTISTPVTVNSINIASGATLIATNTFTGDATYTRNLGTGSQWYFMSSPVNGEVYNDAWVTANSIPSGTDFTTNRGISTYDNSSFTNPNVAGSAGHWRYMQGGGSGTFMTGKGYGIIRSGAGNISFTGSGIYSSNQSFTLSHGGVNNFNLVGNPFTAFITLGTFHGTNSGVIGTTFYFWDGSAYVSRVSNIANADNQNFEIAPGQGFFVESTSAGSVNFETSDLTHQGTDTFEKTTSVIPEIKLNLTQNSSTRYARVYYIDGTTKGYDAGYDGKLFGGVSHSFAIYSDLVESNGKKYQLQSLPNSNHENMAISIGVIADADKEVIFSAETLNIPSGLKVFLEDRLTNKYTRLDEPNSEYKVNLTERLDGIGRFYLHTKSSVLNTKSIDLNSISIYKTNASNLRIAGLNGEVSLKLYSVLGKKVLNKSFTINGVSDITLPSLTAGIYIVQLETEHGSINKKISLE